MQGLLPINTNVGQYRITEFLGRGGMGEVYCAEHAKIGRRAAVKILTHTSHSDDSLDRFFNEARIQSSLRHPNIATLYDFTEVDGQPCIIMEYVDGQTLSERIRPCGAMPLADTVYIFQAVVEAIHYVHSNGVVHRDIKSNNIKISSTGEVKLLDFGIAKSEASQQLTATGSVIGTLEYLSPEQLMGGVADARSDIWALGVLLYEMAVGRVPFEATTIGELCKKIQKVEYTPPGVLNPAVPRDVATIITRCLRKNPGDRYRVARDLLADAQRLRTLVTNPGLSGIGGTEWSHGRTVRIALTNIDRRLVAGIAASILILVVAIGFYFSSSNSSSSVAQTEQSEPQAESVVPISQTSVKGESKTITIDVTGGKARVYREGSFVEETPCSISARIGETVNIKLVQDGFEPYPDTFEVTAQTRAKMYTMRPTETSSEH
ncbi:MAG: serine/threonine protein kinase [Acidobacteriota bacterium]|nr:serine/threonine protein kinase [Acidobacteriota bacterium]